jgi:hypothetical protein
LHSIIGKFGYKGYSIVSIMFSGATKPCNYLHWIENKTIIKFGGSRT